MSSDDAPTPVPSNIELPSLQRPEGPAGMSPILRGLIALAALYLFIAAVNMIGGGLKVIANDPSGDAFIRNLLSSTSNPLTGLCIGLLVTSLVQSSSFTTSLTVALVADGNIPLAHAIPIVMGANIGTSVTNILVSLANLRRRLEFRRSLAGAIVHDFFNVLSVLILLPLEYAFGIISRPAELVSTALGGTKLFAADPTKQMGVLKVFFGAPAKLLKWLAIDVFHIPPVVAGSIIAALALVLLFLALWMLVKMLRGLLQERLSGVFSRTLFRNGGVGFVVGILITAAVQSSSVTTSLVVPLVGAGILTLRQIYPYTLGANIGTTVTAILAALGTGSAPAMACAFGHLAFNAMGTAIFWPLSWIPISLAKGFGKLASRRRIIAALYIIVVFFIIPILIIVLSGVL